MSLFYRVAKFKEKGDTRYRYAKKIERRQRMEKNWLKGKTVIIIGERDGVQGPSIAKCLEAAEANIAYAVTECFV